jgi:hypothetical protein
MTPSKDSREWWKTNLVEKLPCADVSGIPVDSEFADSNTKDNRITSFMDGWMRGDIGPGENGQHYRNDALFGFLRSLRGSTAIRETAMSL